jgi:hypothetical protein
MCKYGIAYEFTNPCTFQQNGVAVFVKLLKELEQTDQFIKGRNDVKLEDVIMDPSNWFPVRRFLALMGHHKKIKQAICP